MPIPLIIPLALAAVQAGIGVAKGIKADKAAKNAMGQLKPYKTPQEVFDVLNATQANAQSGFDPETMNYLTSQTDAAFGGSLATAKQLGSDPNALSAIFGQKINGIMQIGAANHQQQMQNFSAYLNAKNAVAANSAAELKSQQDLLKDQLQKIAVDKANASRQISEGLSTGLNAYANYEIGKLYTSPQSVNSVPQSTNTTGYNPTVVNSNSLRATGGGIRV